LVKFTNKEEKYQTKPIKDINPQKRVHKDSLSQSKSTTTTMKTAKKYFLLLLS